jgi:xanthine dehydrogenase YagR molybdenum-binding subunit
MKDSLLGKGVDRADAQLKVTGKAHYAAEIPVANPAYAVIVTSWSTKGKVEALDVDAAERLPGVLKVLTHRNAPKLPGASKVAGQNDRVLQLLQDDAIAYNDQPIAVVIADTLERAREGATLVEPRTTSAEKVEIELVADPERLYTPKSAGPRDEPDTRRGDPDGELAKAAVRIDQTYKTPVQNHNPMEMHGLTVVWQGGDHVTLYDTSQGIFGVRKKIAAIFDIPVGNVRVISHFVGGGFGCKGSPWSHVALAALAARVSGRAVRLVLTRQQMFSLVGHRPSTIQRVALGADRSGRLQAIRHDSISETSRFDEFVEPAALQTRMLYACPNVATTHRAMRLDIPTPTFMRAPGEATGTFALESAMDELAHELKLDPVELRLRNYAERDQQEDHPWSSKSLRECYQKASGRFGWARRSPEPRSMRDGHWLVGFGMATATYPARQSGASARARLLADGNVLVQAGSQDIGTGTYTIMAQIAAAELGLPLERVKFELGDTALPETPVSGGSQTAASTGSAVKRAASELKQKLFGLAAGDEKSALHGLNVAELELSDGSVRSRSQSTRQQSLESLLAQQPGKELSVEVKVEEKPERKQYSTHSFGAQFVEVRVDEDTGEVRVARCVAAFAAGKILNQKTARSQFHGGIVWGIGFALHEHTARDPRTGRVVTRDLADYHVPVHADVPPIEIIMLDEVDPYVNQIGAKGIGEIGITGVSAAIANAVFHATGKRVRDLPITPDKLI